MHMDWEDRAMWNWVDIDDNRRRIRFETMRRQWQWVGRDGQYHDATDNTFSGAVYDAMMKDP